MSQLLIAAIFLAFIIAVPFLRKRSFYFPQIYRFSRKRSLLTPPQKELYAILSRFLGSSYHIFPQIHLNRLIDYRIKGTARKGPFHHIDLKHVDFVLCDKNTFDPVLVIELSEKNHTGARLQQDRIVEDLINEAHLSFVRIKYSKPLNTSYISEKIHDALAAEIT